MATIRELQATFTATAESFTATINNMRSNLLGFGKDSSKSLAATNKDFTSMQKTMDKLETSLSQGFENGSKEIKDLGSALGKTQQELKDTGTVSEKSMDELKKAVSDAKTEITQLGNESQSTFNDMENIVSRLDTQIKNFGDQGIDSASRMTREFVDFKGTLDELQTSLQNSFSTAGTEQLENVVNTLQAELAETGVVGRESMERLRDAVTEAQREITHLGSTGMSSINDIDQTVQELERQLENMSSGGNSSIDRLSQGFNTFGRTLDILRTQLVATFSDSDPAINGLITLIDRLQNELQTTGTVGNSSMDELTHAMSTAGIEAGQLGNHGSAAMQEIQQAAVNVQQEMAQLGTNGAHDVGLLETAIEQADVELEQLGNSTAPNELADGMHNAAEETGNVDTSTGNLKSTIAGSIGKVVAFVGAFLGLATVATGVNDLQKAINNLAVKTGASKEEMDKLGDSIIEVYKGNYGEDFNDIADSMAAVQHATKLTGKELEEATKKAFLLRDSFDMDINESMKVVTVMMKKFGISSDEAFTLMAEGAANGLNFADDMGDSFWEYSTYFKDLGYDAEEMWSTFKAGADAGAFNLDKVGDSIKEFGIRLTDGSESTSDALSFLFRDDAFDAFVDNLTNGGTKSKEFMELVKSEGQETATEMVKALQKGGKAGEDTYKILEYTMGKAGELISGVEDGSITGKAAMDEIIGKIGEIDDKATKQQIGVALFGTQWEDMGADVIEALGSVGVAVDMSSDKLKEIDEIKYNSIGETISGLGRTIMGNILLPLQQQVMPGINQFLNDAKAAFKGLALMISGEPLKAIELLTAQFGQEKGLAIILFFKKITEGINNAKEAIKPFREAFEALFKGDTAEGVSILKRLGLTPEQIQGITTFVSAVKEQFQNMGKIVNEIMNGVKSVFVAVWGFIKPYIVPILTEIVGFIGEKLASVNKFWDENGKQIMDAVKNVFGFILTTIKFIMPAVELVVKTVWNTIKGLINGALNIIMGAIKIFAGIFTGDTKKMWEGVKQLFKGAVEFIWNYINLLFFGRIITAFKSLGTNSIGFVKNMWTKIVEMFKSLSSGSTSVVTNMVTAIVKFFRDMWTTAKTIFESGRLYGVNKFTALKDSVVGVVQKMIEGVKTRFGSMRDTAVTIFSDLKRRAGSIFDDVVQAAKDLPGKIGAGIKKAAGKVTDGIISLTNTMTRGLAKGVNGVIGGVNWILNKVGVDKKIDKWEAPQYAKGTENHPGGLAVVGDGKKKELIMTPDGNTYLSPNKDTLVNLPKGSQVLSGENTAALMKNVPFYAEGKGLINSIVSGAKSVWDYVSNPKELFNKALEKFGGVLPSMEGVGGGMLQAGKGAFKMVKDSALDFVKQKIAEYMPVGTGEESTKIGPGSGFGGMHKYVEQWYDQVKSRFGPTTFMGAYNNRNVVGGNSKSMHAYGRAFDIGGSQSTMSQIANYLKSTAKNIQYVIYNRKISAMGGAWRGYNGLNPHTDHVHADFKAQSGGGASGSAPTGVLADWIAAGMKRAEVSGSDWANGLNYIIGKESSGNPRAVGAMTSEGTAKGLMQLKDFNYKGDPFDPTNNIFYGIKYIKDRYKSIAGAMSWWKTHNWYSDGTDGHLGGSAVLGDGGQNEPYLLPNGQIGLSPNVATLFPNLPSGTKVWENIKSFMQDFDLQEIAGTFDNMTSIPASSIIPSQNLDRWKQAGISQSSEDIDLGGNNKEIMVDNRIYLDGKEIAKGTYKHVAQYQNQDKRQYKNNVRGKIK